MILSGLFYFIPRPVPVHLLGTITEKSGKKKWGCAIVVTGEGRSIQVKGRSVAPWSKKVNLS